MATRVERNTVIRDGSGNDDGGAGLLVAVLFLVIAGIVFLVWANSGTDNDVTPNITRNVSVDLPDVNLPSPDSNSGGTSVEINAGQ